MTRWEVRVSGIDSGASDRKNKMLSGTGSFIEFSCYRRYELLATFLLPLIATSVSRVLLGPLALL